jgi:hypothetical protein
VEVIKGSRQRERSGRDPKEEGWLDRQGRLEVRRNLANGRGGRMVKREEGEV